MWLGWYLKITLLTHSTYQNITYHICIHFRNALFIHICKIYSPCKTVTSWQTEKWKWKMALKTCHETELVSYFNRLQHIQMQWQRNNNMNNNKYVDHLNFKLVLNWLSFPMCHLRAACEHVQIQKYVFLCMKTHFFHSLFTVLLTWFCSLCLFLFFISLFSIEYIL